MPVPVLTQERTQVHPCNLWQSTQTNRTHAINILTLQEQAAFSTIHTPRALMKYAKLPTNFEHYANPMVQPVTGKCWVRYMHCSNYEARGASSDYKAWGASGDYEARGASGGKYKARMVIFCILAAVNRFSWISRKEESR